MQSELLSPDAATKAKNYTPHRSKSNLRAKTRKQLQNPKTTGYGLVKGKKVMFGYFLPWLWHVTGPNANVYLGAIECSRSVSSLLNSFDWYHPNSTDQYTISANKCRCTGLLFQS